MEKKNDEYWNINNESKQNRQEDCNIEVISPIRTGREWILGLFWIPEMSGNSWN